MYYTTIAVLMLAIILYWASNLIGIRKDGEYLDFFVKRSLNFVDLIIMIGTIGLVSVLSLAFYLEI